MEKIKIDGELKRIKKNILTGKDKIYYNYSVNINNYGITLKIYTKEHGQLFFTINNSELLELIKQKDFEHSERVKQNQSLVNEYIEEFGI